MRKLIFWLIAIAAWKWLTGPEQRPAPDTARNAAPQGGNARRRGPAAN